MSAINKDTANMPQANQLPKQHGFILLPVVMAITLIAAIAYLMNVDSAMNVNSVGKEIESDQARYAALAGMNQMLWQANKANCTGYTNLTNITFGTNNYSATITPTSGSPVSISVTGTHANGASYTIRRDRVKVYQTPATRVLQPKAATGKDTYIATSKSTFNYGAATNLSVKKLLGKVNTLIQFDFSSLLNHAKIIDAQLSLYQTDSSPGAGNVSVHRVLSPWEEGAASGAAGVGATWSLSNTGVSWKASGGDYESNEAAITPISSGVAWINWDISTLTNDWVTGVYVNNGLLMTTDSWLAFPQFASSDSADPLYFPKLTVNFACECSQSCVNTVTQTLSAVADVDIYAGTPSVNFGKDALIVVGKDIAGKDDKILIKFDVSNIPADATVTSATLRLNLVSSSGSGSYDIGVFKIIASWTEATANWSNMSSGGKYNSTQLAVTNVLLGSTGFKEWTLPVGLINEWRDSVPGPNYGAALVYKNSAKGPDYEFASKENATAASRPQLVVTYTTP